MQSPAVRTGLTVSSLRDTSGTSPSCYSARKHATTLIARCFWETARCRTHSASCPGRLWSDPLRQKVDFCYSSNSVPLPACQRLLHIKKPIAIFEIICFRGFCSPVIATSTGLASRVFKNGTLQISTRFCSACGRPWRDTASRNTKINGV